MIDLDFLKQLKKLDLLAKKKVVSSYAGVKRSVSQGRGIEPVDHREYNFGDDLKFVDWKVYARTEKLFIKRFEEDKSLTAHTLVDSSKSMDFKSPGQKYNKFDYASMLAVGFAYLTTKENEKFALAIVNSQLETVLQPKRGKRQFFATIDALNKQKLSGTTNLDASTKQYSKFINSKSLVVVISDFLEPIETIKNGLYRLGKFTQNYIVIQVFDPGEKRLDWQGDVKLRDLETNEEKKIFFSPSLRKEYAVRFMAHMEKVHSVCDDLGADFFSVPTDKDVFEVLFDITHMASRGHRSRSSK
jgi:uncharacterized protein (DUF58 family)